MLSKGEDKKKVVKTNIVLGIVLVVLIILAAIVILIVNLDRSDKSFNNIEKRVDTIEIIISDETNILALQSDQWVLANYNNQLVKPENITAVFTALEDLEVNDIVSSNPAKQNIYEVGETGIKVVMKSGDKIIQDFIVGKNGPSWPSSYIRFQGEDEVYLVRDMLSQIFGIPEWRNMTIIQLSSNLISSLKWSNGLEIIKEEEQWKVVSPRSLDIEETKISTVLSNLNNLEAIDIADIKAWDLKQEDASFILEASTTDTNIYKLAYWYHEKEEGDYDYYVVREGDDNVYILSKYIAENMEKKIEFLEK
ncbi:DUF4340 domain-containing protein [Patescibacteria group bacterium]|nr:DUF4340 domain-containing protein [Patescibacteria group bacterium]